MAVKNYDPNDVIVAFAGRTITGFSDGTYVTAGGSEAWIAVHSVKIRGVISL